METRIPAQKSLLLFTAWLVLLLSFSRPGIAADLVLKSQAGIFTQQETNSIYPVAYINPFAAGLTMPGSNPMNIQPNRNNVFSPTLIPRITGMVVPSVVSINLKNKLGTEIEGTLSVRIQTILNGEKVVETEATDKANIYRPIINSALILPANSNHNYYYYTPIWINDYLESDTKTNYTYFLRSVFTLKDGRVIARDTVELKTLDPKSIHCIALDDAVSNTRANQLIPGAENFLAQATDTAIIQPKESLITWHRLNTKVLAGGSPNLETIWCIALKQSTWDKLSMINRQVIRDYVAGGGLVFIEGDKTEGKPELHFGSMVFVTSQKQINQKLADYHQSLLECLYSPSAAYNYRLLVPLFGSNSFVYTPPTEPDLTAARMFFASDERFFTPSVIQSQNLYSVNDSQLHPLWAARRICRSQSNLTWLYGEDGNQIRISQRETAYPKPGNWMADWADYLTNKTQMKTEQQAQHLRLSISALIFAIILLIIPNKLYRIVLPVGLGVIAILINAPNKPIFTQDNFRVFSYVASSVSHNSADYQVAEIYTNKSEAANASKLNPAVIAQETRWSIAPRAIGEQVYYRESVVPVDFRLITGKLNINRVQDISTMFRIAQVGTGQHKKLVVSGTRVVDDALLVYKGRSYPLGRIVPERPVVVAVPEDLSRRVFLPKYNLRSVNTRLALWDYDNVWLPIKGQVFHERISNFQSVCASAQENIQPDDNELPGLRNFYRAFGLAQWQAGVLPSEFDPQIPMIIWAMQDIPSWMRNASDRPNLNQNNLVFIGVTQVKMPVTFSAEKAVHSVEEEELK